MITDEEKRDTECATESNKDQDSNAKSIKNLKDEHENGEEAMDHDHSGETWASLQDPHTVKMEGYL